MTSKEAIKIAYKECKQYICDEETDQPIIEVFEALKQANKELEVLEMLKKYIRSYTWEEDEDFGSGIELQMYFEGKDKEIFYQIRDYIKKWLENGKSD